MLQTMRFSKGLKLVLTTVMMMLLSAVMAVTAFAAKATDVSSAAALQSLADLLLYSIYQELLST